MLTALIISLLAGLATSVGGLLATHRSMKEKATLAFALAFAAGAMLFVSFVELLPVGVSMLGESYHGVWAKVIGYATFFIGMIAVLVIDRFVPESINPSHVEGREEYLTQKEQHNNHRLIRSGALVAVVLAIHNFPEGMATFFASLHNPALGVTLAVAIAIHNIPEGIAVAAPVYAATGSRKKAIWWATLSGLTEPVGALVAAGLIALFLPTAFMAYIYGFVAGMMVATAINELIPAAMRYEKNIHRIVYGVIAGMGIVAASLILL